MSFEEFKAFVDYSSSVKSTSDNCYNLSILLSDIEDVFKRFRVQECMTHGNPTLENILYSPSEKRIVFIDPYFESMLDCRELDLSQVFQCSRSYYGLLNDTHIDFVDNNFSYPPIPTHNFMLFNSTFEQSISPFDETIVKFFEASQFIRMLPFKCASGDFTKAIFFYRHASKLFWELING